MKTSTINHATSVPHPDITRYCVDLGNWPHSWMGLEKDLPPGEKLVGCFRPFIEHLASSGLSPQNDSQAHRPPADSGRGDHPGLERNPFLRRKDVEDILFDVLGGEGRPLIYHCDSEAQQRSFDSTCRKLRGFLF